MVVLPGRGAGELLGLLRRLRGVPDGHVRRLHDDGAVLHRNDAFGLSPGLSGHVSLRCGVKVRVSHLGDLFTIAINKNLARCPDKSQKKIKKKSVPKLGRSMSSSYGRSVMWNPASGRKPCSPASVSSLRSSSIMPSRPSSLESLAAGYSSVTVGIASRYPGVRSK